MMHCISETTGIRLQKIISSIKVASTMKEYQQFMTPNSKKDLTKYMDQKIFNSNVIDILPFLIANTQGIRILITKIIGDMLVFEDIKANNADNDVNSGNKSQRRNINKIERKLDFKTGWFNTPNNKMPKESDKTISKMCVFLLLENNHYKYLDSRKLADIIEGNKEENREN
jgi:hypothetical protein